MADPMQGPSGLRLLEEVITRDEEAALIALIEAAGLTYPPYDPGNRRASASYGYKYDYANDTFRLCAPLPEPLLRLRENAAAAASVQPEDMPEVLLNRYEPGAVIQPHVDKPQWEHVVGISLGAEATMCFTHEEDMVEVTLRPRSMYVLADDARYVWQHSLPPVEGTRYSITYRSLSEEGRRMLSESLQAV